MFVCVDFFKYESMMGFVLFELYEGTTGCSGVYCFSVMYVGWCNACNFVVFYDLC